MPYQLYWGQTPPPQDCLLIAENEMQAREAFDLKDVVCLGPLSDEAVAEELERYGGTVPCSASMHMVPACDPDAIIERDTFGQSTRLRIRGNEVHLHFDALTNEVSEESFALLTRTDGEA